MDEILLTVDTRPSKGRFSKDWDLYKERLNHFLKEEIETAYKVRIVFVDYSTAVKSAIARYFFGKNYIPDKDFRGGPFYAYFFGLFAAANDLVFHLDSDMFLGGGSQVWVKEAAAYFENDNSCFIVSPLPGPPHPKDILINQVIKHKIAPYTYAFDGMSTRIFMIDKARFKTQKLLPKKPKIRGQIKAIVQGNSNADLPEHIISIYLKNNGLERIDFLGQGKGLWSLHPPFRTKTFYENLETIITNIESGNLPEKQKGFYDIIDEICDWTEARETLKNKRWFN
ncbi:hypothetical protein [Mucilaginibacter flavidus]|uniref:hypothetical protein n=1 Tax=Mucilaginibacter flavidus TaxID=2949309 RepID=UPI0020927ED7|nr:hypothetical protein [Mucilaginibacter flavidus]MCO5947684.1 hypothetical protein [Mucilaginibacter flavidus]